MGGILHTIRTTTVSRAVILPTPRIVKSVFQFEDPFPQFGTDTGGGTGTGGLTGTLTTSATYAKKGTKSKLSTTSNHVLLNWGAVGGIYSGSTDSSIARWAAYNGFTIEGWIYITGNAASYYNILGVSSEDESQFINLSAYQNQTPTLVDSISSSGAGFNTLGTIPLNQWVHVFLTFYNDLCWVGFNGKYEQAQTGTLKRNIQLQGFRQINCAYLGYGLGNYSGPNPNMWCDEMFVNSFTRYISSPIASTISGTYTIPSTTNTFW